MLSVVFSQTGSMCLVSEIMHFWALQPNIKWEVVIANSFVFLSFLWIYTFSLMYSLEGHVFYASPYFYEY